MVLKIHEICLKRSERLWWEAQKVYTETWMAKIVVNKFFVDLNFDDGHLFQH